MPDKSEEASAEGVVGSREVDARASKDGRGEAREGWSAERIAGRSRMEARRVAVRRSFYRHVRAYRKAGTCSYLFHQRLGNTPNRRKVGSTGFRPVRVKGGYASDFLSGANSFPLPGQVANAFNPVTVETVAPHFGAWCRLRYPAGRESAARNRRALPFSGIADGPDA